MYSYTIQLVLIRHLVVRVSPGYPSTPSIFVSIAEFFPSQARIFAGGDEDLYTGPAIAGHFQMLRLPDYNSGSTSKS